jgi:hypothetical protein
MNKIVVQRTRNGQQAACAAVVAGTVAVNARAWQQEAWPAGDQVRLELLEECDEVLVELLALAARQHLLLHTANSNKLASERMPSNRVSRFHMLLLKRVGAGCAVL